MATSGDFSMATDTHVGLPVSGQRGRLEGDVRSVRTVTGLALVPLG